MSNILIVGYGVVGKGMHKIFPDADTFDKDPYCGAVYSKPEDVGKVDLAIICVPTPIGKDGFTCDTSIVESVFDWLRAPLVLIKSTVAPGTTDKLNDSYKHGEVCFSPEYMGESTYYTPPEYLNPENPRGHGWVTLGGAPGATRTLQEIFEVELGPCAKFVRVTAKEAEVVKYIENVFFATKVTFVNEMYDMCEALGVDWYQVRGAWLQDPRICPMHTSVFKSKRGYGGKCYGKDIRALVSACKNAGADPELLETVIKVNNKIRKRNGLSEE